jgi:hypothetical protein
VPALVCCLFADGAKLLTATARTGRHSSTANLDEIANASSSVATNSSLSMMRNGTVTLRVVGRGMLNECLATCTVAIDFRRRSFHIVFGSTFVLV